MDTVTVPKHELHSIVQTNRDKHRAMWKEAFDGYRTACITALELNLSAFRAGKAERVFINESPPEDHTKDYDRVLRMLSMSVDDTIVLTAEAFAQYVMDEWHWKHNWSVSNSKYMGTR